MEKKSKASEGPSAIGDKGVAFARLREGAQVKSPLALNFVVKGMKIAQAGVMDEGTGHHHLIIDSESVPKGTAIPMDEQHIHYGKGQTMGKVLLSPGIHTLELQFADGMHVSYGPEMASRVTIEVIE